VIPWLSPLPVFPPVERALAEPNGLLAAGGDLSPTRLLAAYRQGIFPWYSPGEPILWWSPDPRLVLVPNELIVRRSLAKVLRNQPYRVTLDAAFDAVVAACADMPRAGQNGTWITAEMRAAYRRLHDLGHAHSVEVWQDDELIGGLYGVALGAMFFGESMFSRRRDGSKIALAHLCAFLAQGRAELIDCQMHTDHLASLGARPLARAVFRVRLAELVTRPQPPGRWPPDAVARHFRR